MDARCGLALFLKEWRIEVTEEEEEFAATLSLPDDPGAGQTIVQTPVGMEHGVDGRPDP
jgi:hypothetical protein